MATLAEQLGDSPKWAGRTNRPAAGDYRPALGAVCSGDDEPIRTAGIAKDPEKEPLRLKRASRDAPGCRYSGFDGGGGVSGWWSLPSTAEVNPVTRSATA